MSNFLVASYLYLNLAHICFSVLVLQRILTDNPPLSPFCVLPQFLYLYNNIHYRSLAASLTMEVLPCRLRFH